MNTVFINISARLQQMQVLVNESPHKIYPISTALLGLGEQQGSYQTPRGKHVIRAKIGDGLPIHSVFTRRRPTGEIYSKELALAFPERDWILTRILWLSGLEQGKNRLGTCDSMRRFIYIHGTHEEASIGVPKSRGCIRMRNQDIIELFQIVSPGSQVLIDV